jgi:hypothetical protein
VCTKGVAGTVPFHHRVLSEHQFGPGPENTEIKTIKVRSFRTVWMR